MIYSTIVIRKAELEKLYNVQKLSMMEISHLLNCSVNKVVYWMDKHNLIRRTISEAVYQKSNPNGDPFSIQPIETIADAELFGMGVGLFWGEGTKASKHSVRLGNTDPMLLKTFMKFLIELFGIKKSDMKFGLQIFTDINAQQALNYWAEQLDVSLSQFHKVHITISGSLGTYKNKSQYGVVTIYYHNKKLRDIIVGLLPK